MNALPLVERAEAYLSVQLTHSGPHAIPDHAGPFVTISRESGTGGMEFAARLADRLYAESGMPWTVYSTNLIEEMLRANNLPPQLARFLPEDRVSEVDASVGEIFGLHPNLWALVRKTKELTRQLARSGHAILIGRGANFATADLPHGIHLRLIAPAAVRAARTAQLAGIDFAAAGARNAEVDAARARYVHANFGANVNDASAYDVIINTDHVPLPCSLDLVQHLVAAHATAIMSRA